MGAIPSRHLCLSHQPEDPLRFNESDVVKFQIPDVIKCDKMNCQELFLTSKSLHTYNQRLIAHIKSLEKRLEHSEEQSKRSLSVKDGLKNAIDQDNFILGPTQLRCVLNK